MTEQQTATWRRFTVTVAALAGLALAVGLALSYGSVYRAAYDAGFNRPWIDTDAWQLRPAHLFPLTLDVPVLVGYAGTIALAGRRAVTWARVVLVACSAATISLQVADGADLIHDHESVRAVIHGWPPALGILTAHLLVLILQALGVLTPPVAQPVRPSWVARGWTWLARTWADMKAAEATPTPAPPPPPPADNETDTTAPAEVDKPQVKPRKDRDTARVSQLDKKRAQAALTALLPKVVAGDLTQAAAARQAGVSTKTVARRVSALKGESKDGQSEQQAAQ